ncbi:hypothetical protein VDG1235_2346 [Verrucomicrobiia bacterium DG1235]|nr:hypothetical protein VDG1235_2346 [Verrucomicrobiae bacterium DG1235]
MLSDREKILFKKSLTYANGYRELAMFDDALAELDNLDDAYKAQKELHQMRLAILMEAKRWKEALPFANILASSDSSDPGNFVNLAYVTRRASGIEGAQIILENAANRFPDEAIIQYNLGCYATCNNELDTAKKHLLAAFKLDQNYLEMALKDEDVAPLQSWLSSIPKSQ